MRKEAFGDESFEQSFFQLAYSQLQSKNRKLNPHLIGFEVVKRNDEGTKGLGVFGFKSQNGQLLFVPVFFINGAVKSVDLLYSKNNSQFYPLTDEFADLLLQSDSDNFGDPSKDEDQKLKQFTSSSDLRDIVIPPRTGRYTYASDQSDESILLGYVKSAGIKTKKAFRSLLEKNAEYMEAVLRFHDMEKVAEAIAVPMKAESAPEPVLALVTKADPKAMELEAGQKQDLMSKGFVFVDKRKDDQKSQFAPIQFETTFTTADESGCYPYITANGSIALGLVLVRPQRFDSRFSTDESIVVALDGENKGKAYMCPAKSVFIKNKTVVKDISDAHKDFENVANLSPSYSKKYVLVTENLKVTQPFKVNSNFKDGAGVRRIQISLADHFELCCAPSAGTGSGDPQTVRRESNYTLVNATEPDKNKKTKEFTLVVTKTKSDKLEKSGDTIYVPSNWKALEIDLSGPEHKSYEGEYTEEKSRKADQENKKRMAAWEQSKPGTKTTLFGALRQRNIFPMTLTANGGTYFATLGDLKKRFNSKTAAKIGMVMEFGMGEKEASELVDSVVPSFVKRGYIKVGYTGEEHGDVNWEEPPWTDVTGVPTTSGAPYQRTINSGQHNTEDYTQLHRGTVQPGEQAWQEQDGQSSQGEQGGQDISQDVNRAVQMSQYGQKEMFDTQSIAALAKYVSPDDKIELYVPDLITALDRLGRILFLVNWDMEKFTTMYGRADMPEFVDLVKNVFKNMGELVIFLKKKKPELSINMTESESNES